MSDLKYYFQKARSEGWALGAFNVSNLETLKAVVTAAKKLKAPILIEASGGELKFIGTKSLRNMADNLAAEARVPVFLNVDHGKEEWQIKEGLINNFDLIHFDGSVLPYEVNLKKAWQVSYAAHRQNILVEGEIDHIEGSSALHQGKIKDNRIKINYTDPKKAQEFCQETNVDLLAVSVGNIHGVFSKQKEKLDLPLLKNVKNSVKCFLSLHGGSGIKREDLKKAIKNGIVKINVNTDLRLAYRRALERELKKNQAAAIYEYMPPVIEAVQKVVEEKIKLFGSNNKV